MSKFKRHFGIVAKNVRKVRNRFSLEELEQLLQIGVWEAVKSYKFNKSTPYYYLTLCATNRLLDELKKYNRKKESFFGYQRSVNQPVDLKGEKPFIRLIPSNSLLVEDQIIQNEFLDEVINFAKPSSGYLSLLESKIFYGIFIEEKTYKELSEELGIKPKSVDNGITRIKKKLNLHFKNKF